MEIYYLNILATLVLTPLTNPYNKTNLENKPIMASYLRETTGDDGKAKMRIPLVNFFSNTKRKKTDEEGEQIQINIDNKTKLARVFMTGSLVLVLLYIAVMAWTALDTSRNLQTIMQQWEGENPRSTTIGEVRQVLAGVWWFGPLKPEPPINPLEVYGVDGRSRWWTVLWRLKDSKERLNCLQEHVLLAHQEHKSFRSKVFLFSGFLLSVVSFTSVWHLFGAWWGKTKCVPRTVNKLKKQDKVRRELKEIGVRILEKEEVEAMTDSVCQYLGAGSYGSCTKTVDPHTQEEVVVKTFKSNFDDLLIETKNLHQLQIPGVQRLMGVCVDTCQLLTYFAGDTAIRYFEKDVPFVDAATVFLQIARTLKGITTRGFTHNDLKHDNVCVSDGGNSLVATIIDLGLMKPIGTECVTRKKRHLNHPDAKPWVAPELVTQTRPNSEASDAYSLSLMMFALLTMKTNCVSPDVDEGLMRWIETAFEDEPAKRPTLTALVVLLEEILEDASKRDSRSGDVR